MTLSETKRGTCILDLFQRSPLRVLFPLVDGGAIAEAVIVNTAGGIAGGDRLESAVTVLGESSIAITSQAAEKIYRTLNEPARIATTLTACGAARLAWLPQESICFDGARLHRQTVIEVSSEAELLVLEWLVLGRSAHGEKMLHGTIVDGWRVEKEGRLVWADIFRVTDDVFPNLHDKALLGDCSCVATLIYVGPERNARLDLSREIAASQRCHCSATTVGGLVIVRFAASTGYELKLAVRRFLERFGRETRCRPFGVPKMWSC
jgi:urease accessory protein